MHVYENNVYGKDVENGSILSGDTVVYRDHVNRAQNADQAAGTCERFVYSGHLIGYGKKLIFMRKF